MVRDISLTDARKNLSALLREIETDPSAGYRILVRKRVVAELRSPVAARPKHAGVTLVKLALEVEKQSPREDSAKDRDDHRARRIAQQIALGTSFRKRRHC